MEPGAPVSVRRSPGTYELISIILADAIGVACQEKGDAVGLVVQAGGSSLLERKVREIVERKTLKALSKKAAKAYFLGVP